ncbi:MAG: 16S rRNA (guanine(527)-N(7))-methyltransferase RsmG [Planctomycetota bacterium]
MTGTTDGELSSEQIRGLYALNGIRLEEEDWDYFERLRGAVRAGNERMNLTRLTSPTEFLLKHVLDSLLPFREVPSLNHEEPGQLVADLGSGAGFPGLVIAYMHPSWDVALIERTAKKAGFLEETAAALGLKNVFVVPMDAAEAAAMVPHLERACDIVFARAVGRLAAVTRAAHGLLKPDGRIAHFKGGAPALDELAEGESAAETLGMRQLDPVLYTLPPNQGRSIVLTLNLPNSQKRAAGGRRKRSTRGNRRGRGR